MSGGTGYSIVLALIAASVFWLPWLDSFAETVPPALPSEALFLRLALGGALAAFVLGAATPAWRTRALVALGAFLACAGFEAVKGLRIVDPQEVEWIMHGKDGRWFYLTFEFFRREPWTWPPGRVTSLYYPVGTSVGNTDSVPLLSLPLKLVNTWLPDEFQFLGFWMLACVALQGAFAGLLMRAAGGSWPYQSLGVFFFLLSPSAVPSVERVGLHTGRWLTLAALWLSVRPAGRLALAAWAVVIAVAGLTHPYTCVMVAPMAVAYYARRCAIERTLSVPHAILSLAALALLLGSCWWLSGYFAVSSIAALKGSLGHWSMNLLAPINPMGWSSFLPAQPTATTGQYEGFHYLGLGVLLLIPLAALLLIWLPPSRATVAKSAPLLVVALFLTVLALSPKVTAGSRVLFELPQAPFAPFAPFRASGRLFLPVVWMLTFASLRIFARRLASPAAVALLVLALYAQWSDLGREFERMRLGRFQETRFQWDRVIRPEDLSFPGVAVNRVLFVPRTAWSPDDGIPLILAAARAGLAVSSGHASRADFAMLYVSDRALDAEFEHGPLAADAIYAVAPNHVDDFKRRFRVHCRTAAKYTLCIAAE
jgi:hypothetical protein